MSGSAARFGDLPVRIASALILAAIAGFAVWQGGWILSAFVAILAAAVGWEQARMHDANAAIAVAGLTGLAVILCAFVTWEMRAPFIVAATGISQGLVNRDRTLFTVAHAFAAAGAVSFLTIATAYGTLWLVWLVGLVVLTDVAGYFAGKAIGGPKFWPAISPKKTWAGTASGWIAAGIFGAVMAGMLETGFVDLAILSVVVAFASQMGDIFESFVKRRAGIKDSSGLIPGHGGVWDRFDAMLAASLAFWPAVWVL